ncbi:MAG: PLP-dependent aminotransferase family protein [Campylobacteraceae bacterium]|nr:PLP-dependent aminotransferase family protein [Campylobacteraceae bacterium]
MYIINHKSKTPLYIQLYTQMKKDIMENYKAEDKLPSIRKIASLYNLSKNTVESSYSQLVVEGYIDSNYKSAYTVTDTILINFQPPEEINVSVPKNKEEYLYDFFPARLSKDSFPLKLWKRLFVKGVDETLDFGAYPDGQGEVGLRVEIAKYIIESRGVKCHADQIIVSNGLGDSLGLVAKILKNNHEIIAMEHPGYSTTTEVFDSYSYKIDKIALDENGIKLDLLEKSKAKLVYTTPSHQYPTGVIMPISNRLKLLKWAQEKDALIIEDDYDSELSYENRPIPALQGLDHNDRVIYLGTFSKFLSASLRVGYMVLPNHLMAKYKTLFNATTASVSITTQKTLELFMSEGHWESHLRKIRTINRKKHNLMKTHLQDKLGSTMKIESQGAGLAILINPTVDFDWEKLKVEAKKQNMKNYFAKAKSGGEWEAIRMGFGGFEEDKIEKAIEVFSKIWHNCLK